MPIHIKNTDILLSDFVGNQSFTKELDTQTQYGFVLFLHCYIGSKPNSFKKRLCSALLFAAFFSISINF